MMAALGVGSRPCRTRTCSRNAVCIRFQVPSLRHVRQELHTVDQGGNSCGKARHWQPVRSRYKMALITSRISVVRGCPPGLAGGISGSRILHSLSVTSLGSLLRFIFPPLLSTFPFRDTFSFFTLPLLYHLAGILAGPLSRPMRRPLSSFIWLLKALHTAS